MGLEAGTISEAIITQEINGYYSRPAIPDKCFYVLLLFFVAMVFTLLR